MKKLIPLLLALMLLCACSAVPEAPAGMQVTAEPTPAAAAPTAAAPTNDEPAVTESIEEEKTMLSDNTVTLDGLNSYLRLTLPKGWTWVEEEEPPYGQRSVLLSAPTDDGFSVRAVYWDFFGMCGTGVTFADYALPNGAAATLATETIQGEVCWTLILPQSPDPFTLHISAPQARIDAHQSEIDALIGSLQTGELSHIPPQPTAPTVSE